jgi:hypothetical protein
MNNRADEVSQAERRRIMIEERRASTYMDHAMNADLELGGRFKALHPVSVTGADPAVAVPQQPSTSPWHQRLIP